VRNILLWHALEETEHKAVAFDVYRAVGGSERMRRWGFRIQSFGLISLIAVATALSLLGDRSTYNPVRLVRSLLRLRHSPFLQRDVLRQLADYRRVGFHPDDHDNTALLEHWTRELFGPDGRLADHLH
jgi:predicted metal-dependent hydrolase